MILALTLVAAVWELTKLINDIAICVQDEFSVTPYGFDLLSDEFFKYFTGIYKKREKQYRT